MYVLLTDIGVENPKLILILGGVGLGLNLVSVCFLRGTIILFYLFLSHILFMVSLFISLAMFT